MCNNNANDSSPRARGECWCIRRARLTINRTTRSRRIYSRVRSPTGVAWRGGSDLLFRAYRYPSVIFPASFARTSTFRNPNSPFGNSPPVRKSRRIRPGWQPAPSGRQVLGVDYWSLRRRESRWIEEERRMSWPCRKAMCSGLQSGNIEITTGGHAARKDWPLPTITYLFD